MFKMRFVQFLLKLNNESTRFQLESGHCRFSPFLSLLVKSSVISFIQHSVLWNVLRKDPSVTSLCRKDHIVFALISPKTEVTSTWRSSDSLEIYHSFDVAVLALLIRMFSQTQWMKNADLDHCINCLREHRIHFPRPNVFVCKLRCPQPVKSVWRLELFLSLAQWAES